MSILRTNYILLLEDEFAFAGSWAAQMLSRRRFQGRQRVSCVSYLAPRGGLPHLSQPVSYFATGLLGVDEVLMEVGVLADTNYVLN